MSWTPGDGFYLAEPPESVWACLEGGPVAEHEGEVWQFMGMERVNGHPCYCFRHRNHPTAAPTHGAYTYQSIDA